MSRHELNPLASRADIKSVVVGWDRPLDTFFVQVRSTRDRLLVWKGAFPGEIPTATAAIALVRPYATVPADLQQRLEADRTATADEQDGPAQVAMKQALGMLEATSR